MADIIRIPVDPNQTHFEFRTTLEEVDFVFSFRWNNRMSRWIMDIKDAEESPLILGQPLNVNVDYLARFKVDGLPDGQILFVDATGSEGEAGVEDLGDSHFLGYITSE